MNILLFTSDSYFNGFKLLLGESGLKLIEIRPFIDSLTLIVRSILVMA